MNWKDIIIKFIGSLIFTFSLVFILIEIGKGLAALQHLSVGFDQSIWIYAIIGAVGLTIITSRLFDNK